MGVFDRIERKLEGAVVGVFAKAFKGDVQPIEIAARLQRELDREAKLLSRTSKLVPNDFTVGLSQHDYDRLAPYGKKLSAEILPELTSHASEHGYVFNGPIAIRLELDEALSTGRFTVSSLAMEPREPTESEVDTQVRTRLVLEVNGMRHPLTPPGVTIGRGSEADVRINDPGISRKHAEIQVAGNNVGELIMQIVDLGSTNGITVNGQKVRRAAIEDGTRIEIGRTRMLVHDPSRRS